MKRLLSVILTMSMFCVEGQVEQAYKVDLGKKVAAMKELVDKALPFFKEKSIEEACQAFRYDLQWRAGEIGIFVFNSEGVCYVFGQDNLVIWKDFYDKKTTTENDFLPEMLQVGKEGGIVNYQWNNSNMQSYVRTVQKNGKNYVIGAGFFPASAAFATEQLVKNAVRFGQLHSPKDLFEQINNPRGKFIYGDVYLYVYDFDGNVVAHGESPELVGQNVMDQLTSDGKYRAREMIAIAMSPSGEGWYSYKSMQGNLEKRAFIQRLNDKKTNKSYMVAGGYYPSIDENMVVGVVKNAIDYLRENGAEKSFPEFSKRLGKFAKGSISLFAYDTNGTSVADISNPAFVGLNLMNTRDKEGKYITRLILQHANRYPNGGWIGYSLRNAYAMVYIEKVNVPDGDFIIGATYYPDEKYIHVRFMVDRAVLYLKNNPNEIAFSKFSSHSDDFLRGDTTVFVYNQQGITLVDGQDRSKIWQAGREEKDDAGKSIADRIMSIASTGGGWVDLEQNNATRKIYVNLVKKDVSKDLQETYIVGSGYYL